MHQDTLSLSIILNREIRNDYETKAKIIITIIIIIDLEAKTEITLDPIIEVDHKIEIDLEAVIIILEIEVILENKTATILMLITIEDPLITHLPLIIVISTTLSRTLNLFLL